MSNFSDYIVYVDESGDHNLIQTNPNYPMFVLAFCIFEKSNYVNVVVPRLQELKFRWFGHDCVVLHEHEIRKRIKPFDVLSPKDRFDGFMEELSAIIDETPMTVITAAIDKTRLKARYQKPANPYELAMQFCMERLAHFLTDENQQDRLTHVVFERRGRKEDRDLELEFRRICDGYNHFGKIDCLDIRMVDKKANSSGLQLADLVARPVGLSVLRPDQPNRAFDKIEPKLRRSPTGQTAGYGLKIFPK